VHPLPGRALIALDPGPARETLSEISEHPPPVARPRHAAEKAWMEMAEKNARLAIEARLSLACRAGERLHALCEALDLPEIPVRIECFDVSHTMGEATVASCVVCVEGAMKSSEYRRYNIDGITPGDDLKAMRQTLERRFGRVAEGEGVCPDLILIDGGLGQLSAAQAILSELGLDSVNIVGVAKGEGRKPGLETLVFPDGRESITLGGQSPALHLVIEIRDEAHRFAVTGHRARRDKARLGSKLEDIPGVGPARRRALLSAFGGLDGVRAAAIEDLCRVEGVNRKLAEQIYSALH
jgi:excinuclease ABC subunit C